MEDRIRDAFGGTSPRISVGFPDRRLFGFAHHFHLGTPFQLSFAGLLSVFRACVRDLDFYDDALADAAAAVSEAFRRAIAADAKTRERDAASAAHARLAQIRAEFTSSPKTVTIVNPASLAAYDGDVDVEISLGGVPPSYLGLAADEQPRVIVLLNGGRVPLQDVNVSSAITNPVAPQPSRPVAAGASPRGRRRPWCAGDLADSAAGAAPLRLGHGWARRRRARHPHHGREHRARSSDDADETVRRSARPASRRGRASAGGCRASN